ncbi:MAG: FAD-dependent oxidoreductase [Thermoguttaceae bacterium]|nr:FAD-dependent oxidoreductase [Thermoguttaceae bacterium]
MGIDGDGWDWHQAGTVTTTEENQKVKVELEDLTGFDGRVDALVFTQEDACPVPSDPKALEPIRHAALNLPDIVPDAPEEYELVVVGGGVPGCSAAISAARLGVKVALIQDRPVLGGNASTEVRVHICGKINLPPYTHLGDLVKEMGAPAVGNGQYNEKLYKDQILYDLVKAEENITLYTCIHVYKAEMDATGKKIVACYGQDIRTGAQTRFVGKWFVDCTGDAMLGYEAGADYHIGREAKSEYGEAAAPEKEDMMTMGASVMWTTIVAKEPTTFPVLKWAHQFTAESAIPSVHGDWQWETGIGYDQVYDIERIRDNGLRAAFGHWSYMKNQIKEGKWYDACANRELGWVAWIAGKRESRRLLGDVVLKQQDIQGKKQWEDACVTASWSIDLHLPEARNHKFFPGDEFYSYAYHNKKSDYAIPYRTLYSRNIDNLFMAGRNISVTHVGLGTVRVMRTGGMMGEVVGMAASLCKKYDTTPRGVYNFHLGELKKLMEKGIGK